jgi:hypothetical protein
MGNTECISFDRNCVSGSFWDQQPQDKPNAHKNPDSDSESTKSEKLVQVDISKITVDGLIGYSAK